MVDHDPLAVELARLYPDPAKSVDLLRLADLPLENLPTFGKDVSPAQYWRSVLHDLDAGRDQGGREALAWAALKEYPDHPVLQELAGGATLRPAKARPSRARTRLSLGLAGILAFGVGSWVWFSSTEPPAPAEVEDGAYPEIYAVRVIIRGPDGQPLEGSEVVASAGNEPQEVRGGWEVEIPEAKVPAGRRVTIWAKHAASGGRGEAEVVLKRDPVPAAIVTLAAPEGQVHGVVRGPNGMGLEGARVSLSGGDEVVVTEAGGRFELSAPNGATVDLHVEHELYGFKKQSHRVGDVSAEIVLGR